MSSDMDIENQKKEKLASMIKFSGMLTGETHNKTIQQLKEEVGKAKNSDNTLKGEKLKEALQKIKELDQSIIEDFDNTLMDGLD